MTIQLMRITCNQICAVSSHLARFMTDLVSKNGRLQLVFGTIIVKVQVDRRCVK